MKFQLSAAQIIEIVKPVKIVGEFSGTVTTITRLSEAQPGSLSFFWNPKYIHEVEASNASILLLPKDFDFSPKSQQLALFCEDPSVALAYICHAIESLEPTPTGIHPTAVIHPTATIGDNCFIGPYVVIEEGVCIGDHTSIGAHTFIGAHTQIGSYGKVFPNVSILAYTEIGNRVTIHPGAVIGSDGYGFATIQGEHKKIPQIGNVILEDDTDIGANTTIDRARFASTVIGKGTKIDNLVQIGHNVRIGEHCLIVAQVGIAGSTELGNHVTLGGQVGVAGHLHVADGTTIGAQSGVARDTQPNAFLLGSPAVPYKEAVKQFACIARLPEFMKKIAKFIQKK